MLSADPGRVERLAGRALSAVGAAARNCGIAVAMGIARLDGRGRLRNEAVFFDRRGEEVARYAKIFLWNFDSRWFAPGDAVQAFDTEFGRLGMMICADGRMPEIARTLARRGAWLVLDPTAWVSVGHSYATMYNPQVEHVMLTRARENGIWIAAADKFGSENDTVHYVGRSMIVSPAGEVAAAGPPGKAAIVVADLERTRVRPVVVSVSAAERRALRARAARRRSRTARRVRVGILQGPFAAGRATAVATLEAQGVDAMIDTSAATAAIRRSIGRLRGVSVALIAGRRMLAPEPARAAALAGADIIVWVDPPAGADVRAFAKTRALENRFFVIVCGAAAGGPPACVIDASGSVIGEALEGRPSGFAADIDVDEARDKVVVPGSDIFAARIPAAFELFDGGARR
jgi:predicted amidohydrolase